MWVQDRWWAGVAQRSAAVVLWALLVAWALALGAGCLPVEGGQAGGVDPASCKAPLETYWFDGLHYHRAYPLAAQFLHPVFGAWLPGSYICLPPQPGGHV